MLAGHTVGMTKIAQIPPSKESIDTSVDHPSQKIADAVRILCSALPTLEQQRILRELTDVLRPIATPRAGKVLGAIVQLLPREREWNVAEVKKQVAEEGVQATTKAIYNALGYLTRKGHIRRVGYGRYVVSGIEIITSDDLGGEPARDEDD